MEGKTIRSYLEELINKNSDIISAVVTSQEGLPIAYYPDDIVTSDTVAAVSGSLVNYIKRTIVDIGMEITNEIIIKSEKGYLVIFPFGSYGSFSVVTTNRSHLGLTLLTIRSIKDNILERLKI